MNTIFFAQPSSLLLLSWLGMLVLSLCSSLCLLDWCYFFLGASRTKYPIIYLLWTQSINNNHSTFNFASKNKMAIDKVPLNFTTINKQMELTDHMVSATESATNSNHIVPVTFSCGKFSPFGEKCFRKILFCHSFTLFAGKKPKRSFFHMRIAKNHHNWLQYEKVLKIFYFLIFNISKFS